MGVRVAEILTPLACEVCKAAEGASCSYVFYDADTDERIAEFCPRCMAQVLAAVFERTPVRKSWQMTKTIVERESRGAFDR